MDAREVFPEGGRAARELEWESQGEVGAAQRPHGDSAAARVPGTALSSTTAHSP